MNPSTKTAPRWLLYGATGYTGVLIAEEAVRRGHRPVLAGRSREKLAPLAARLGLDSVAVGLEDARGLVSALEGLPLVVHAAGPFVHTSEPMVQACLAAGAHYLDITGEIPVFENTFRHDAEAKRRGVVLMSGVGFDVVPTDCLALYVAQKVPGAHELELAIAAVAQASPGTTKSMLEGLPSGGFVRRGGQLQPWPMGQGVRRVRFSDKERTVIPIPWGDLATAWHSTGIPNITTYMAQPAAVAQAVRFAFPVLRRLLSVGAVREGLTKLVEARVRGPDEALRQRGRSQVWAQARAPDGRRAEAVLETPEAYAFTAVATVRAVEEVLAGERRGALTPAQAFGADFVLSIEGARRMDLPV
ncbi:saccharopine dehydrogenase family protein [Archangium lansingense]|uniref:Saccharopine dehydrogenase NADP-binding domain-containing protein n=1 Tax=Archangium lansingense TaxID=2995310 RepID=A0ABT3ZUI4_9BACT|nr:saccharopine dehydrogenase NADP-binding domain-containing protein [Archangium lansinium]MCY1073063.1 saccharopine dehydrogenase NADP-binding domain-containing protein [Archangium lansinium]